MQEKEISDPDELTKTSRLPPHGRIVALDIGTKRVGVAVCDELRVTVRPLPAVERTSWKKLLQKVKDVLTEFDAAALVLGLPYNFDGSESEMSSEARRLARNFGLSLDVPVLLQDERVSSYEARGRLWKLGLENKVVMKRKDSESAAVILADFLDRSAADR